MAIEAINIEEFLSKPFETKELAAKIEKVFNKREEQGQAKGRIAGKKATPQQKPKKSAGEEHLYCNRCNKHVSRNMRQCPECGSQEFRISYEY